MTRLNSALVEPASEGFQIFDATSSRYQTLNVDTKFLTLANFDQGQKITFRVGSESITFFAKCSMRDNQGSLVKIDVKSLQTGKSLLDQLKSNVPEGFELLSEQMVENQAAAQEKRLTQSPRITLEASELEASSMRVSCDGQINHQDDNRGHRESRSSVKGRTRRAHLSRTKRFIGSIRSSFSKLGANLRKSQHRSQQPMQSTDNKTVRDTASHNQVATSNSSSIDDSQQCPEAPIHPVTEVAKKSKQKIANLNLGITLSESDFQPTKAATLKVGDFVALKGSDGQFSLAKVAEFLKFDDKYHLTLQVEFCKTTKVVFSDSPSSVSGISELGKVDIDTLPIFISTQEKIDQATSWIRQHNSHNRKIIPDISLSSTPPELTKALLDYNQGICIGESHESCGSKSLVLDTIKACQDHSPIDTLFLEHLLPEHQKALDEYFDHCDEYSIGDNRGADQPKMPEQIERYLMDLDRGFGFIKGHLLSTMYSSSERNRFSFRGLVKEAIESGVRVVALEESMKNYKLNQSGPYGANDFFGRSAIFHKQATEKIESCSGKWIALIGYAHLNTLEGEYAEEFYRGKDALAGIAELVGCPSIVAKDAINYPDSFKIVGHQRAEFTYEEQGWQKGFKKVAGVDFTTIHDGSMADA